MKISRYGEALIGYTGFVGSNLLRNASYGGLFNSKNIDEIRGREFDRIICAGVSAVKWLANKEPEADRIGIEKLTDALENVKARQFVLISTVDVYPWPRGVTEADEPDLVISQPYGKHRRLLEQWVCDHFEECIIVRLPALFGAGLKKNAIFDLMTGNMTDKISPNGCFQWYPMRRFSDDLEKIVNSDLRLVNIAVEPMRTKDIVERFFKTTAIGPDSLPPVKYDMRTLYPHLLGGDGHYHILRDAVMDELCLYLKGQLA